MPKTKSAKRKVRAPKAEKPEKKKDPRTLTERMRDEVRKHFNDESAADTFGDGGYSMVREVLPTGIEVVDRHVVGIGGLPYGRIVEVSGLEDTGKSSFINGLIAAAQRDGATASLGDSERKVQPNWVDTFRVSRPDVLLLPATTVEEWIASVMLTVRKFGARNKLVFILDSVPSTTPKKAFEEDLRESEIPGAMAASWSRGLRQLNKLISERLVMVILVNQLRSRIGVLYGPTEETAGGRAIKQYASLRLSLTHGPSHKEGPATTGKWVKFRAQKNHLASGYRDAMALLHFEQGWDDHKTTMLFARKAGAVASSCRSLREARVALGWETNPEAADVQVDLGEDPSKKPANT